MVRGTATPSTRVMLRLFINSAGYRVHDYAWHEVTPTGDLVLPDMGGEWLAGALPPTARRLISLEAETYVVARTQGQLLVLIAGLASEVRKDFAARRVEDTLVISGGQAAEPVVRAVAAKALARRREFIRALDQAIAFDEATGFAVKWRPLATLLDSTDLSFHAPDCNRRTTRLSESTKEETAAELQIRRLPPDDGLLLLASRTVAEDDLIQAGVWRGLWGLDAKTQAAHPRTHAADRVIQVARRVTRTLRDLSRALLPGSSRWRHRRFLARSAVRSRVSARALEVLNPSIRYRTFTPRIRMQSALQCSERCTWLSAPAM
jgi:hypothetical protein